MSIVPESPANFYEGLFMNEGHFVQFRLGYDNLVWVDEAIESTHKPKPKIVTKIYGIKDAVEFQTSLIDFGYHHLPAFELPEEYTSQYIN